MESRKFAMDTILRRKRIIMSEVMLNLDEDVKEIWKAVNQALKVEYGEAVFRSWFSKMSITSYDASKLVIATPTRFIKDWIFTNYHDQIRRLWKQFDPSLSQVEFIVVKNEREIEEKEAEKDADGKNVGEAKSFVSQKLEDEIFTTNLDPRFTFDNFVVGKPNQLAYAAARSVAESAKAQSESNPLFLYGGVGLGKTHLMNSIAWHIKSHNPERKVIYMSAEKFMYQFVRALRNKDIMSFKEHFRSVDVLMIDDVQFICGKESTQEEFFHTFNALIDNHRQMVISCDRSPSDLDNMEDRIKSRLGWGLVADVHSTTYELRLGILESKVEQMKAEVPKSVMEFLASKITSNIRELEGALNKVVAHSNLIGREINIANTREILQDLIRSNERLVTIEEIQKTVAEKYNIKVSDMYSGRRVRSIARPRQIAMFLAKNLTSRSLSEIGKKFGGKDHTTVMHAVKTVEDLMKKDAEIQEDIDIFKRMLS